jgi:hypothetical protein
MTLPSVPPVIGALAVKPRWDKYDPYVGNFRAPLAVDATLDQANLIIGVGLNSSGACVLGAGQTGIIGVIVMPVGVDVHGYLLEPPIAGNIVDVGKRGEITNFATTDYGVSGAGLYSVGATAPVAGTKYYLTANGAINTTSTGVYLGHTVEASRLIVCL